MAIADHGTFSKAAASLHVSQPALSHAIARLERELGSRLFERSAARTELTAACRALLGPARRVLAEVNNGRAAVEAVAGVFGGELRVIGVRTAVSEVAHLVARFHRRHPGVRFTFEEPTDDHGVVEAVHSGRTDIGIVHSTARPAGLLAVAAGEHEIVAIFPEELAPPTPTVTMEFLCGMAIIAPLSGTGARLAHDRFFREATKQPRIIAECSDNFARVELVRGGLGATLMSRSGAAIVGGEGIEVRYLRPQYRSGLTALRRRTASPAAGAFCHMLLDTMAAAEGEPAISPAQHPADAAEPPEGDPVEH